MRKRVVTITIEKDVTDIPPCKLTKKKDVKNMVLETINLIFDKDTMSNISVKVVDKVG